MSFERRWPSHFGELVVAEPLLHRTQALLELLSGLGRVGVAFSGGVDSAVVAAAAQRALGARAIAFTAASPSLAAGELEGAVALARHIGIRHQVIHTQEFADPHYVRNSFDRCYFCKSELYRRLLELAPTLGIDVLVNGANADDRGDHRPGMVAAQEFAVRSPLLELQITKREVREIAREWGLPVWDKPASPCLASRIAYGLEVTPERVARVDAAERFLKECLSLRELRVRYEPNDLARLEVPLEALPRLLEPSLREQIVSELRRLGFRAVTVDLQGFRSGSFNDMVPVSELRRLTPGVGESS